MNRQMAMTAAVGLLITLMLSACGNTNQIAQSALSENASVQTDTKEQTDPIEQESTTPVDSLQPVNAEQVSAEKNNKLDQRVEAVKKIMQLAKQGKVAGSAYGAKSGLFDDVEKDWGKPDKNEPAGKGFYATYAKKHIVFGYNKGMQIFDVRSERAEVQALTLSDVEKALGKPKEERKNGRDAIYVYQAGEDYELKFVVPAPTKQKPNPHVHHISVYYPKGAVNLMLDDTSDSQE